MTILNFIQLKILGKNQTKFDFDTKKDGINRLN
ncbi:hypothetical protein FLAT13_00334 [Flavobacterium salmonis]|uniref:Uncharacterized protein n=1 Tax=Flavobacterium salmonis TaxID=2654844 RepID=A0A6V6YNJ4_9FLAO|nr:hypothetical protein FLAT13_00334 [Flavobacterium salmonis]